MSRSPSIPLLFALTSAVAGCGDDSAGFTATDSTGETGSTSTAPDSTTGDESSGATTGATTGATDTSGAGTSSTGSTSGTTTDVDTDTDTTTDTGDGPPFAPELYVDGRTHSPITPYVAASLAAIAEAEPRRDDVFAKIGASSTVSKNFLHCFDDNAKIDLFGRDQLWDAIDTFRAVVDGTSSFGRTSLCATVGWSAITAIKGDPSALQLEIDAADPRFAVILYGTNDINLGSVHAYGSSMLTLVETLTSQGVVPILTSIMPRDDNPDADAQVPIYNAVIRSIAQAHQIPFIDFHRELLDLEDHGLAGDGIHRAAAKAGACVFDPGAMEYAANIRNLLSLQALDRARITLGGVDELDPPLHQLGGAGLPGDPYVIPALPFGDRRDTSVDGVAEIDSYPGCNADQDESGRELYYRFEVAETTTIRAIVIDRGEVDVDLHLVDESASGGGCIARSDGSLTVELSPGTYHFVLDTYVSQGIPAAGEYLFVVEREPG